jgi:uncharacterized protein YqhQ
MVVRFPRWFLVWHLTAAVLIVLSLVGGLVWSVVDFAAISYVVVMSVLMLPLPLTYFFRLESEASSFRTD